MTKSDLSGWRQITCKCGSGGGVCIVCTGPERILNFKSDKIALERIVFFFNFLLSTTFYTVGFECDISQYDIRQAGEFNGTMLESLTVQQNNSLIA